MTAFDYVIAGGGTAGCVLAARLSEDPSTRVLLLEAGRGAGGLTVRVPAAFSRLLGTDRDWALSTEPVPALSGRRLFWPRGKMLGGCSSLNAMMVVRGNRLDYDGWAAGGCDGWSFDEVLPYFKRSEDSSRGPSELRGVGGPFAVRELQSPLPATRAFVESAIGAGLPPVDDVNGPVQDGVGLTQVNQRGGERWSVVDGYLGPARRRANLDVRTRAEVTRVVVNEGRATGVEYRSGGRTARATARRGVILTAGAVGSPHLLMRSGIGPGAHLQEHGVRVLVPREAVGADLQDHLACGLVVGSTGTPTLAKADGLGPMVRYLLTRRGPLTSNVAEACAFVRSRPGLEAPDLELIFAPAGFVDHGRTRLDGNPLTLGAVALQPESRGRVRLAAGDDPAPPAIEAGYLEDPGGKDLEVLVRGLELCREIVARPPLADLVTGPLLPDASADTADALAEHVRARAETLYHPVGTCRMGSDPDAVLTPALEVRGVGRLWVADASVMPRIVRGHPHWAVIMIAEKASDLIRSSR